MFKNWNQWKRIARVLESNMIILYLSLKDPRVPFWAKAWIGVVVLIGFSPFDLIPDFIPILGILDDLIFIPIGIYVGLKLIPKDVLNELKIKAESEEFPERKKKWYGLLLLLPWIVLLIYGIFLWFF